MKKFSEINSEENSTKMKMKTNYPTKVFTWAKKNKVHKSVEGGSFSSLVQNENVKEKKWHNLIRLKGHFSSISWIMQIAKKLITNYSIKQGPWPYITSQDISQLSQLNVPTQE